MHRRAVGRLCTWSRIASVGICIGYATSAMAERDLAITVSGSCPPREAVITAIESGLPDVRATDHPGQIPRVLVIDDGASYRIEIDGATRTFVDSPTDCEERARTVAVVAALAIEPPPIDGGAPLQIVPATTALAPRASTTAMVVARRESAANTAVQFEVGGVLENGAGSGGKLSSAEVALSVAVGWADRAVVIGGAVGAPISMDIMEVHALVRRVPLDIALRNRLGNRGLLAATIEIGPRFVIQHSEHASGTHLESATRLEVGARFAARLEVWPSWTRGGAYALLEGEYVPRPSRFTLADRGVIGEMPSLWIGASLGLAIPIL